MFGTSSVIFSHHELIIGDLVQMQTSHSSADASTFCDYRSLSRESLDIVVVQLQSLFNLAAKYVWRIITP